MKKTHNYDIAIDALYNRWLTKHNNMKGFGQEVRTASFLVYLTGVLNKTEP